MSAEGRSSHLLVQEFGHQRGRLADGGVNACAGSRAAHSVSWGRRDWVAWCASGEWQGTVGRARVAGARPRLRRRAAAAAAAPAPGAGGGSRSPSPRRWQPFRLRHCGNRGGAQRSMQAFQAKPSLVLSSPFLPLTLQQHPVAGNRPGQWDAVPRLVRPHRRHLQWRSSAAGSACPACSA